MHYIELNPLRAKMVNHPSEYRWSSYAYNAKGNSSDLITPHPVYLALKNDDKGRQQDYRELFLNQLEYTVLHEIRDALNQELVIGRGDFKDKIEQMTNRQTRRGKDGRPRIEEEVGDYFVL